MSSVVTTPIIVSSMLVGLALGGFAGPSRPLPVVIICVLALQTLLTVGALPRGWFHDRGVQRNGWSLVGVHHLTSTVPLLALAALLGWGADLGVGLIALAIAPVAAGAPVYASAAGVDPRRVAACTVQAYTIGIVVTPLLALLTLGRATGFAEVAVILIFGLAAPTVVALALQLWIERIPALIRFLTIGAGLFVIAFCYGGTVGTALRGTAESEALLGAGLLIGVLRGPVCATLAVLLGRAIRFAYIDAAAIVGGYKNITLSAGIALAVAGPVAAAPSIGGFLGEAITLGVIARLRATRSRVLRPAPRSFEAGTPP